MSNEIEDMIILLKKNDYAETEILEFQGYFDSVSRDWIVL